MNEISEVGDAGEIDALPTHKRLGELSSPVVTINHPEHGELVVGLKIGRSRVCTKQDGSSVTISSRLLNKLTRSVTTVAPEEFVESVKLYLESLGDTPERDMTARNVWVVCDEILEPKR